MTTWCIECGIEKRVTPAVGENDEGDPACVEHGAKMETAKEATKPNGHAPLEAPRTCSVEGCTIVLKANNKTGRCTAHWYVKKGARKNAAPAAKPKAARKPARGPEPEKCPPAEADQSAPLATMRVSEPVLDLIWSRLTLAEKAHLLEGTLNG